MLTRTFPLLSSAALPMLAHVRHFSKHQLATDVARINQELDELFGRQFVQFQPLESPFLKFPTDIEMPISGGGYATSSDAAPSSCSTSSKIVEEVTFVDSSGLADVVQVPQADACTSIPEPAPWTPPSDMLERAVRQAGHAQPLESPFLHFPTEVQPCSVYGVDLSPPACSAVKATLEPPPSLTHVDGSGAAAMVDVGEKPDTERMAAASGQVLLGPEAFALVQANQIKKGDVLTVAKLAGMMGAKQTSMLIPLCHNIPLTQVDVHLELDPSQHAVNIHGVAKTVGKTGVEMEALTAVSVAALTVYDMCKAVTKEVVINAIQLEAKSGGCTGEYFR